MNELKASISFTQIGEGIIVPTKYVNEPSVNKTVNWVLGILGFVGWLMLVSANSSTQWVLFSTLLIVGFGLVVLAIQFTGRLYWVEFNKNTGKVSLWRNRKKKKLIGEYNGDQIKFSVGKSGSGRSKEYFNLTITFSCGRKKLKLVPGNFWNLCCYDDDTKPVAEAAVLQVEKIIRGYLAGKAIQSENNEVTLVNKIANR